MTGPKPSAKARVERPGWIVLAAVAGLLVAFSVASSANFSSIVVAQSVVYIDPSFRVTYRGLDAAGLLIANGSAEVNVSFRVVNPSDRSLRVWQVDYCAWMEDLPVAAGLNASRQTTDKELVQNSTVHWYYPVMCPPVSAPAVVVPPHGEATVGFLLAIIRLSDPARFAVVQNITGYAVHAMGNASAVAWNHWAQVSLLIDGVPPATSLSAGSYILKVHIITREVGTNLG